MSKYKHTAVHNIYVCVSVDAVHVKNSFISLWFFSFIPNCVLNPNTMNSAWITAGVELHASSYLAQWVRSAVWTSWVQSPENTLILIKYIDNEWTVCLRKCLKSLNKISSNLDLVKSVIVYITSVERCVISVLIKTQCLCLYNVTLHTSDRNPSVRE